jgi:polysaccharide export outer membrane protein
MINASRLAVRWASVLVLCLYGLVQTGCRTSPANSAGSGAPDPEQTKLASTAPFGTSTNAFNDPTGSNEHMDLLHVGDVVTIEFTDAAVTFLPREERIKEDGTITLIEGKTFAAAGKTRGQLEREIHDCYVPQYYLKMTVSIRQKEQTQFYYVRGEVKQPARQIYISRIRLLQAIASAGDFTDFARKKGVLLTRSDGRKIVVNCIKARQRDDLNLEILPGDIIDVPRRNPFW